MGETWIFLDADWNVPQTSRSPSSAGRLTQAAQRGVNTKQYRIHEKGIDSARIELRTGMATGQTVDGVVPPGASFSDDGTTLVDESSVKPQAPPEGTTTLRQDRRGAFASLTHSAVPKPHGADLGTLWPDDDSKLGTIGWRTAFKKTAQSELRYSAKPRGDVLCFKHGH
jgi:hypothetical protein